MGTIIGNYIIDLKLVAQHGGFDGDNGPLIKQALSGSTLNLVASLPYHARSLIRDRVIAMLSSPGSVLFVDQHLNRDAFVIESDAIMHLPVEVHSFTDFLCSETHLENVSRWPAVPPCRQRV